MTLILKRRDQILVVEDDPDSCELIGEVLHDAGYSVDLARDGFEGLEMAARRPPDLVVSDLQMPGLDGVEFTHRIHVFAPALPVVLTTGVAETRDLVTSPTSYGAVACLRKPMNLEELLWTIDRALVVVGQQVSARDGRRASIRSAPRPSP
jgi:two-component system response regulator HydG